MKGPEMTTNNPDPLEVLKDAVRRQIRAYHVTRQTYDGPGKTRGRRMHSGDDAAATAILAIIAQHYAPVIAENERLRTTGARLLEWWPEGSGNSLAGHNKGSGFADDLEAFRQALGAKP